MVTRTKIGLKMLPYVAGIIFAGMWIAAMDVSSELSLMEDSGLSLYHDPVDVRVFWLESKACMVLPPDGYIANCTYFASISVILVLTVLLAVVLAGLMILRRREVRAKASVMQSRSRR